MNLEVANTIRQQLGGSRFSMMTGAKNFAGDAKSLQFQIGRFAGLKVKYVKVTLEVNDLYTMTFFNRVCGIYEKRENVYNDQLAAVFTEVTGLDTKI